MDMLLGMLMGMLMYVALIQEERKNKTLESALCEIDINELCKDH